MKKLKLTKLIASSLIVASVLALNPIGASAEWRQDSNGWWYAEGNSYVTNQWKQINGKWFYFDSDGYMVRNTVIGKYYINNDGQWVDDSMYNITAFKAQEIVKQYFTNKGTVMPQNIKVEQDCGNSWGVHCYDGGICGGTYNPYLTTYGWYFIDKTTGKFVSI